MLEMHLRVDHAVVMCEEELQQTLLQMRTWDTHGRTHVNSDREPKVVEIEIKQQGQSMKNGEKAKMQCTTVDYCTVGPCSEAGCFFQPQREEGRRPIRHQPGPAENRTPTGAGKRTR